MSPSYVSIAVHRWEVPRRIWFWLFNRLVGGPPDDRPTLFVIQDSTIAHELAGAMCTRDYE